MRYVMCCDDQGRDTSLDYKPHDMMSKAQITFSCLLLSLYDRYNLQD